MRIFTPSVDQFVAAAASGSAEVCGGDNSGISSREASREVSLAAVDRELELPFEMHLRSLLLLAERS